MQKQRCYWASVEQKLGAQRKDLAEVFGGRKLKMKNAPVFGGKELVSKGVAMLINAAALTNHPLVLPNH